MDESFDKTFSASAIKYFDSASSNEQQKFIKGLESLVKTLKNKDVDSSYSHLIFRFGAHKDKPITEVPAGYLLWCYQQDWFKKNNKDFYEYIKTNLKRLKKQKEEEDRAYVVGTVVGEDFD
jgi:hypothetical protein